jgi:NitT/TauT family transport system substrate-binding protein
MRRTDLLRVAAAGVVYSAAPRSARAQGALEKLRLVAIPSDALTPLYYGLQTGLFQRAGIDLEITPGMSGAAATTAVVAGAYDIANTSLIPAMAAHLRGITLLIVAPGGVYTPEAPFGLLQIPSDSPYKTGADLNGKIMGTPALNDLSQLSISCWVDKNGGDSKTLKFVEIPNAAMNEALVQHRVAAAMLLEPLLDASVAAGNTKTIGDPNAAIARTFMFAAYVGRPDWAKEHADLLRRFVRVAGQAATYTNAHTAETAPMMAEITKIPLAVMQRMKRVVSATSLDPRMVQPLIDAAAKYKNIPQAFPAKDLFLAET